MNSEAPAVNPTNWTCDTETLSHRVERVAGRPETSEHDADVCRAAAHRMRRLYFGTDTERKYSERYTALSAKARNYKRQIKQLQGALNLWRNVAENAIGRRIIDDLKRNPR